MRRALLLGTVLLAVAVGGAHAGTQQEASRVFREPYHTAAPGPFLSAEVPTAVGTVHAGGTTIPLEPDEQRVEVFLLDATHRKVPGRLVFYAQDGTQLELRDFCFQTAATVPAGAANLTVHPSPLYRPCPIGGVHGPATTGELLVALYD